MASDRNGIRLRRTTAFAALLSLIAAPALAQQADGQDEANDEEEIVVTGTIIRGVAPTGTNSITIGEEAIERTGATDVADVLAQVPQVTNSFNTLASPLVAGADPGTTITRPNLRNLAASGANTTLVLVDGHNVVGAGVLQTTPDASLLPPGALQRVEIMADGGSSLYGADAIGGIVNYITRREQEGVEVDASYGFSEDGYRSDSIGVTAGHDWDRGSMLVSLYRRTNDGLLNGDRELPRQDLTPFGGSDFRTTVCPTPQFVIGANTYRYESSNFVLGAPRCEGALNTSLAPAEEQNSAFFSLRQEISSTVEFDMTAFYSRRDSEFSVDQITAANVNIPNTNFYFTPQGAETSQAASFSYSPALGLNERNSGELEVWGITPTLTFDITPEWQMRVMYNYGESYTATQTPGLNTAEQLIAANGTTAATALNPYNIAATDAAVLARITDWETFADNTQTLHDFRVVADGPLFELPAGAVRMAIGMETQQQNNNPLVWVGRPSLRGTATRREDERTVDSVFGQLNVPIIGSGNRLPLVHSLDFDFSARYDNYSDFGDTTNPKFGFTWGITEDLRARGNIGTSFNAPSLADSRDPAQLQYFPTSDVAFLPGGGGLADFFRPTVFIAGGNQNLQPQTAETWSVGVDWDAPIDGLTLGATYWSIGINDVISVVPPGFSVIALFDPIWAGRVTYVNPTQAEFNALMAAANPINLGSIPALYPPNPFVVLDLRRGNYGSVDTQGIDIYANLYRPTDWGAFFGSLGATYHVNREATSAAGTVNVLTANFSRLQLGATAGAEWNQFTASATVLYSQGYDTNVGGQTEVDSFSPLNLAFSYDFEGAGFAEDLRISLNVDNVFDDYPPFLNSTGGTANGQTLGRIFTVGLRKRF